MAIDSSNAVGTVYLVGAGPGDPGLLTLRAVECLARADLVIHDQLVPPELLVHAPRATHVCVGKLHGPHAQRHEQIYQQLIEAAREGKCVVRLKGGDPWLFARGGEEAEVLRAAGIPFEVVPGVTAALAAAACVGIPLTHRELSSSVTLVTGHECPGKAAGVDWPALARLPGTLAIYMGRKRLAEITQTLQTNGKPPDTPVAVVRWATTGAQHTVAGTLATIAEQVEQATIASPVIVIIGPVVGLRSRLAWFESRPLFGRHVLVTRPRRQAAGMIRRLEELGATVHAVPMVEIGPALDGAAFDSVLGRLVEFDWLVFTSANGVEAVMDRLWQSGRDLRALSHIRLAAIGSQTAAALAGYRLRADIVPDQFTSEGLATALTPLVRGQRVLLARADRGREVLLDELSRVAQVEQVAVYSQVDCVDLDPKVRDLLRQGRLDFVTLTSSSIARSFIRLLDETERARLAQAARLVTISPVTSAVVKELGLTVAGEARPHTAEGVVQAVLALAGHLSSRSVSMQM